MPGLTGIISSGAGVPETASFHLEEMTRGMMHEPFISSGTCAIELLGLRVGWALRSELHPEVFPIWTTDRKVGLILSGEVFSDDVAAHGQRSDAVALLRAYEERGIEAIADADGWFSGVFLDLRSQETVLFNDRYGLGRIYYHRNGDVFWFASEAKLLLKALPECRRFHLQSFGEYLSCGCVLENRTLFQGINLLPPASAWRFSREGLRESRYFSLEKWTQQDRLNPSEYEGRLGEVVPAAVRRFLGPQDELGMSLTGGLDGRMIMACLPKDGRRLRCYTFGGPYRACADVKIARRVAAAAGLEHQIIAVGDRFLEQFTDLAERAVYASDGCMDVSGAAELYANRVAREICPWRMTGNYGSEILRSHVAFRPDALRAGLFSSEVVTAASAGTETYRRLRSGRALQFIVQAQLPWHHYSRLSVEESQVSLRSPFLDRSLVALAFQAPAELERDVRPIQNLIRDHSPVLARIPNDRGVVVGVGNRAFLNAMRKGAQEFLARVEYAYDYGMPPWAARIDRWLAPLHLERWLLGFQKFCHFRVWYRDRLRAYVLDTLRDARTRARTYYEASGLNAVFERCQKGDGNVTMELHRILTLEIIERRLLTGL